MDILKGGSISFSYMSETVGSHVFKNLNGDIILSKFVFTYLKIMLLTKFYLLQRPNQDETVEPPLIINKERNESTSMNAFSR